MGVNGWRGVELRNFQVGWGLRLEMGYCGS